ncbi:MAG TPA: YcaO-like family protein [Herpetosiphonaceae bacterium]
MARFDREGGTTIDEQTIIERLKMEVVVRSTSRSTALLPGFSATARTAIGREPIYGSATGSSPELARRRAVMECVERYAQFGCYAPPVAVVDTYAALMPDAISPLACGLYSAAQYASPDFGLAAFSEQEPLEWLDVVDLTTGAPRLLPVEFIYPRASLTRQPLVAETSSGTAAHSEPTAATVAALCELVERDSFMQFWYRQPTTQTIPIRTIPQPDIRAALQEMQAVGYVVTVCSLVYDVALPCFLVLALKGDTFAYGLGCHPSRYHALHHAMLELAAGISTLHEGPLVRQIHGSLLDVRTPADHYHLYNGGPFHQVLRQVLSQVLRVGEAEASQTIEAQATTDEQALAHVLDALAACRYRAYGCDITPAVVADYGTTVQRVLIPGLIPIHFGYQRWRLGCRRLTQPTATGRLATLLPHFMA